MLVAVGMEGRNGGLYLEVKCCVELPQGEDKHEHLNRKGRVLSYLCNRSSTEQTKNCPSERSSIWSSGGIHGEGQVEV